MANIRASKVNGGRRMRVAVNYLGRKGGGMVYAYEMTKGLVDNGCDVYAIVPEGIENLSMWKELKLKELILVKTYTDRVSFVWSSFRFVFFDLWKLKKHFRDIPIDVCYVPMLQPWTSLLNSVFKKSKRITTLHDPKKHEGCSWLRTALKDIATKGSDQLIILSDTFREFTVNYFGVENHRIHTIPHGVFDYYEKMAVYNIEPMKAQTNFLFFGRIEPYKGLQLLVEAYAQLVQEGDDVSLRIAGSGDLGELHDLLSELKSVKIDNRYIPDEEVYQYFQGDRVVAVLPYFSATQSGVIPIAMQAGSQIIATDTGGLREQTCDGKYAILCAPTVNALYEAMKHVASHYEQYADMRSSAERYVHTLSWNVLAQKLIQVFSD